MFDTEELLRESNILVQEMRRILGGAEGPRPATCTNTDHCGPSNVLVNRDVPEEEDADSQCNEPLPMLVGPGHQVAQSGKCRNEGCLDVVLESLWWFVSPHTRLHLSPRTQ